MGSQPRGPCPVPWPEWMRPGAWPPGNVNPQLVIFGLLHELRQELTNPGPPPRTQEVEWSPRPRASPTWTPGGSPAWWTSLERRNPPGERWPRDAIRMAPETLTAIQEGEIDQGGGPSGGSPGRDPGRKEDGRSDPSLPSSARRFRGSGAGWPDPELPGVRVRATATLRGKTGVEMEALTAAAVALLTVYDMVKAMDRGMVMEGIRLMSKEGGRSGTWTRQEGK